MMVLMEFQAGVIQIETHEIKKKKKKETHEIKDYFTG